MRIELDDLSLSSLHQQVVGSRRCQYEKWQDYSVAD